MKLKPLIFFVVLMLALLSAETSGSSAGELVVVTAPWHPYVTVSEGKVTGADVEIALHVFNRLGYTLEIKVLPWKRCINDIKRLQADVILCIGKTGSRESFMIYPEEYSSVCYWALFYRSNESFQYEGFESLIGKTIGTLRGYHYGDRFMVSDDFRRDQVTDTIQNFKKLVSRRVDMVIDNRASGIAAVKQLGAEARIRHTNSPIATGALLYTAFSKKYGNVALARAYSAELKRFKKTTEYMNLIDGKGR